MKSATLFRLLQMTWHSPIFHDAYPPELINDSHRVLDLIEAVHNRFVVEFKRVLEQALPHAPETEIDELIRQVAPKTTAFCAAIPAGELDDLPRLSAAAVAIATSYWADQSMDRGDEAMLTAVRMLNNPAAEPAITRSLTHVIRNRLTALRQIELNARRLARPEDVPTVVRCIGHDVLLNQAFMRDLSRRYMMEGGGMAFWQAQAETIAELTVADAGLPSALTPIYAIYRHYRPELPSLAEIYAQPELVTALRVCNATVRIFDDFGDRQIDEGRFAEWGSFNLNLFNQSNPQWLRAFMRQALLTDPEQQEALVAAFQRKDRVSDTYITQRFVRHLREHLAGVVAGPLGVRYGAFLTLAKRVMEAGYVNSIGDIALAGTSQLSPGTEKADPPPAAEPRPALAPGRAPRSLN